MIVFLMFLMQKDVLLKFLFVSNRRIVLTFQSWNLSSFFLKIIKILIKNTKQNLQIVNKNLLDYQNFSLNLKSSIYDSLYPKFYVFLFELTKSLTNLAAGNYYKFDKKLYTIRGLLYESGEIKHDKMSGWQHVDDVTDLARG